MKLSIFLPLFAILGCGAKVWSEDEIQQEAVSRFESSIKVDEACRKIFKLELGVDPWKLYKRENPDFHFYSQYPPVAQDSENGNRTEAGRMVCFPGGDRWISVNSFFGQLQGPGSLASVIHHEFAHFVECVKMGSENFTARGEEVAYKIQAICFGSVTMRR